MNTEKISRDYSRTNSTPIQSYSENQEWNQAYEIKTNRTLSKSIQSRLKNLVYTLSRPFRFLIKQHIEKSIGTQHSAIAIKDIKRPVTSIYTTQADLAKSPKTSENTNPPLSRANYEITGGKGGHHSPTFAEKFFRPKATIDTNR